MSELMSRRAVVTAAAGLCAALAGCGSASPPAQFYQLPADPPEQARGGNAAMAGAAVWELSNRIGLPGALDRDVISLVRGSEVEQLAGHRWAEPLRESVPRVLRSDLERLRGRGSVWLAPVPTGLPATPAQLRVEVSTVEATGRGLRLLARWYLNDARSAPQAMEADLTVDLNGNSATAVVAAYRLALWRLAERIAQTRPA